MRSLLEWDKKDDELDKLKLVVHTERITGIEYLQSQARDRYKRKILPPISDLLSGRMREECLKES